MKKPSEWEKFARDQFDAGYSAGYGAAMEDGWGEPGHIRQAVAAALDAAREAVAATFIGWCKDYMNCTDYEHVCGERRNTLAAIDALRKDDND